jgi:hypothetical protein
MLKYSSYHLLFLSEAGKEKHDGRADQRKGVGKEKGGKEGDNWTGEGQLK